MWRLETELAVLAEVADPLCQESLDGASRAKVREPRMRDIHSLRSAAREPDAPDVIAGSHDSRCERAPLAGVRNEFFHRAVRRLIAIARIIDDISEMRSQVAQQGSCLYLFRWLAPSWTSQARPQQRPPFDTGMLANFESSFSTGSTNASHSPTWRTLSA
jgi:hypothetical protein